MFMVCLEKIAGSRFAMTQKRNGKVKCRGAPQAVAAVWIHGKKTLVRSIQISIETNVHVCCGICICLALKSLLLSSTFKINCKKSPEPRVKPNSVNSTRVYFKYSICFSLFNRFIFSLEHFQNKIVCATFLKTIRYNKGFFLNLQEYNEIM